MIDCISWFRRKSHKCNTFRSNDGFTGKQLDHVLVKRKFRSLVEDVKVNHRADVLSDHSLVVTKVKLHLKVFRSARVPPKLDLDHLRTEDGKSAYNINVRNRFEVFSRTLADTDNPWPAVKSAIMDSVKLICPKRRTRTRPWISDRTLNLRDEKNKAPNRHRANFLLREIRRCLREDEKAWLDLQAANMEEAAARGDSRMLFLTFKLVAGQRKSLPNTIICDSNGKRLQNPEDRLVRWSENFDQLLNRPDPDQPLEMDQPNPAPGPPVSVEEPSAEEVRKVISNLKSRKSPGPCDISAEILKALDEYGVLLVTRVIQCIWRQQAVPQDFKDSTIVPIFKKALRLTAVITEELACYRSLAKSSRLSSEYALKIVTSTYPRSTSRVPTRAGMH